MATATTRLPDAETRADPTWAPYRMSAEEFFRAVDADVFPEDRRVELWEGIIYELMAKKLPHSIGQLMVSRALSRRPPDAWLLWPENPILVNEFTAPLPDLSVVRGTLEHYYRRGSVPAAADIGLVVEVADSSLRRNRTETLAVYARANLPAYWIVNLVDRRVEVYTKPGTEGVVASYASSETYEPGPKSPWCSTAGRSPACPSMN